MATRTRVSTAWIQPTSTAPDLLVNRADERERLVFMIQDAMDTRVFDKKYLVTGPRGVGKSILAKAVMEEIGQEKPVDVALVEIEGRSITYRTLLERFADRLSRAARDCFAEADPVHAELDQLGLLAQHGQITWSQVETIQRRYGIGASAKAPGLVGEIGGSAAWEEQVSLGQVKGRTMTVGDALLHEACERVLSTMERHHKTTIVLFDDLDQVGLGGDREQAIELFKRVLDLRPCIALVHLRSEAMVEEIRREIDSTLEVGTLPPDELVQVLLVRARHYRPQDAALQAALSAWTPAFRRLAAAVDTPLTFLRWVHGLLDHHGPVPPADWAERRRLLEVASTWPPALDPALLDRLLLAVDHCANDPARTWCRRADLLRGGSVVEAPGPALSEAELELLIERVQFLVPRNRHDPEPVYRVSPEFDLLRPSVAARLAGG